jgi:peroxiredoxin Q/BCP
MFWSRKPKLLAPGTPAPDFSVQDHLGRTVRLADLRGQRTILYWYPKADTPGCTKESCAFRDRWPQLSGAGRIYGVSFDSPAANKAFVEKYQLPFPLLCDTTKAMSIAYGAAGGKRTLFPSRITYVIAADGTIEHAEKVADIPAHVEATVARLRGA